MQAVIKLDVPEWQIGQPVTVYFPDTMQKQGVCELLKEQEAVARCKDCVHYCYYGLTEDTVSECVIGHCENPDRDWFCADGEVKLE